ncbi:MAG: DEAD/DEAH box helicase [Candidatus Gracilibacteria bacterium]|nr:DEAD/DEAH box helicase [Candidatus Gracilibacteria bacterium]
MYCLVAPFSKTFDDIGLIYFIPDFLMGDVEVGQIVEIPYRNNIEIAIILEIDIGIGTIKEEKIKSLIGLKHTNIFLNQKQISLLRWMAEYYITPIHNISSVFFPKNLLGKIENNKLETLQTNKEYQYLSKHNIIFSPDQETAYQNIISTKNDKVLLYGITGSGKTEIYIKLISDMLQQGKQSLLLIPEIILTHQISKKIIDVFGEDVLILNSTVSAAVKTKYWCDIYTNKAKIIVGTRSALFYPFQNLGIIIVDEEHDGSYISDQPPRYHVRDVVNKMSDTYGMKLILASGTPSIQSMYDAVSGKYSLVSLLKKFKK